MKISSPDQEKCTPSKVGELYFTEREGGTGSEPLKLTFFPLQTSQQLTAFRVFVERPEGGPQGKTCVATYLTKSKWSQCIDAHTKPARRLSYVASGIRQLQPNHSFLCEAIKVLAWGILQMLAPSVQLLQSTGQAGIPLIEL